MKIKTAAVQMIISSTLRYMKSSFHVTEQKEKFLAFFKPSKFYCDSFKTLKDSPHYTGGI